MPSESASGQQKISTPVMSDERHLQFTAYQFAKTEKTPAISPEFFR